MGSNGYHDYVHIRGGGNGGGYYEYLTDPDGRKGYNTSIAHHRVIAWAHGELDRLDDDMEVDHVYDGRTLWPLLNFAGGLEAIEPSEHWDRTHDRRRRRRVRATQRGHKDLV